MNQAPAAVLDEAKTLIEQGDAKAVNRLLHKKLPHPLAGASRRQWISFLRNHCNELKNKTSSLPIGIEPHALKHSGVPVVVMPSPNSDAEAYLKVITDALCEITGLDLEELEALHDGDDEARAYHQFSSHIELAHATPILYGEPVKTSSPVTESYRIGTAGRTSLHWIAGSTTFRSGWINNIMAEIISHGGEGPTYRATHLTVMVSVRVSPDGAVEQVLPTVASYDDAYGIRFGICSCTS